MILTVGNKVIYPCHGLCLIGPVVKKVVDGRLMSLRQLALLDDSGGEVFVPLDKTQAVGIRHLVRRSEIPKLLDQLKEATRTTKNWKQRTMDNLKLFASGSAFDLAKVVESLTELGEARTLSSRDRHTLDRARKLLVWEISEVTGETKTVVDEQVDRALKGRKG